MVKYIPTLSVNYSDLKSVMLRVTITAIISEMLYEAVWQSYLVATCTICTNISTDWEIILAWRRNGLLKHI